MLVKVIKELRIYKTKYGKYPKSINITNKSYKILKKELSIVENITEYIKEIYFMDFRIIEKR